MATMTTTTDNDSRLVRELGSKTHMFLARVSMGVEVPEQPSLPFEKRRIAMAFDRDMHPLFQAWNNGLEPQLVNLLKNAAVNAQMTYLTAVRVGYEGLAKEKCPLTILIAVQPGSIESEAAQKLLDQVSPIVYQ